MAPTDETATGGLARPVGPQWQPSVLVVEGRLQPHDAAKLNVASKEVAHEGSMLLDHMERPVLDPIAERNNAAHPHSLLL